MRGAYSNRLEVMTSRLVECVELRDVALLKIVKQCRESSGKASGYLLGLEINGALEISWVLPVSDEDARDPKSALAYQTEMLSSLRGLNLDSNIVGWFQSHALDQFSLASCWDTIVTLQNKYQEKFPNAVLILFDPTAAKQGSLYLKALRLTTKFRDLYTSNNGHLTSGQLLESDLSSTEIFEEVPVKLSSSFMNHALLYELRDMPGTSDLKVRAPDTLTRSLTRAGACIDEYVTAQNSYMFHLRRKGRQQELQQVCFTSIN